MFPALVTANGRGTQGGMTIVRNACTILQNPGCDFHPKAIDEVIWDK